MDTRAHRSHLALAMLFCIFLAAFDCSMRHGDANGLHLQAVGVPFCGSTGNSLPAIDLGGSHSQHAELPAELGCLLLSSFSALALAAFFTLLGLLSGATGGRHVAYIYLQRPVRAWWPPSAPRAPPFLA